MDPEDADPHDILAAVRGFIGCTYLSKTLTIRKKQILLESVFQAITDELNSRYAAGTKGLLKKIPLDRMNTRLIKRIKTITTSRLPFTSDT